MASPTKHQVRQRRRSSWNQEIKQEWNLLTSPLDHLRDSLCKVDDDASADGQLELIQSISHSPRWFTDTGYINSPSAAKNVPKPSPRPKPRPRDIKSATDNVTSSSDETEDDYVQPFSPTSGGEGNYLLMHPIYPKVKESSSLSDTKTVSKADTLLNKIVNHHLLCKICNNHYEEPKILTCSHSFCRHCLSEKLQHQNTPMGPINCPTCRVDTPVPKMGVNDLHDNTLLCDLVGSIEAEDGELLRGQRSDEEVFKGEQQSREEEDRYKVVQMRSVKTYERMSRKKEQPLKPFIKGKMTENEKCAKHPNNSVTHFCKTCQLLICDNCTKYEHNATKHICVEADLNDVCNRKRMEDLLELIRNRKVESTQAVNSTENAYCRLHNMIHHTKKKIDNYEREEISRIKEKAASLKEAATKLGNDRAKRLEKEHTKQCERAENVGLTEDILQHAIFKASKLELLVARDKVVNQANKLLQGDVIKPMHSLSFLDFAASQHGPSLLLTEQWELQEECIKRGEDKSFTQVGYVAMYSNGDIAITDMVSWQLLIISQTGKGCRRVVQSHQEPQKATLVKPFSIAINMDDELLVIDNQFVKVFDRDLKFLFVVPTACKEDNTTNSGILSCLAVDKQNRIAVGNRIKNVVSLHQQDGELIRVVPTEMIDTQLTISYGDRLIYSNYEEMKLISVHFSGQRVFCVSTADKKPTGVCCDSIGYIYVAMHSMMSGQCEIHNYTPNGEFIGCMVQGLINPLGIILTPHDKLAVADKNSVKLYCRV